MKKILSLRLYCNENTLQKYVILMVFILSFDIFSSRILQIAAPAMFWGFGKYDLLCFLNMLQ